MTHRLPDTLAMITRLIQCPSISSTQAEYDQGNLSVIHCLAEWLEGVGFQIDIRPLSAGKANLIATLGPPDTPGGLVLSGHTDTVPCNPERWHSDPFKATLRDDRIYGLGSADMKSFDSSSSARVSPSSFDRRRISLGAIIICQRLAGGL